MIAKFRNTEQAIVYLCEGLAGLAPEAMVEVVAVLGGGYIVGTRRVPFSGLHALLARESVRFPEATVVLGQTGGGSPYGAIQCTCTSAVRAACPHHCEHSRNRPLLLVLGSDASPTSQRHTLDEIAREVHEDLKAERRRSDLAENENLTHDAEDLRKQDAEGFRRWLERN
jgi:hypothetical protein